MIMQDGWRFGVGFALALIVVRLPIALLIWAMESWLAKLRENQVVLHGNIAKLKRAIAAAERTMGRDPEAR